MDASNDVFSVTLLHPDEYAKLLNQIAGLTTRDKKFLKRKFVSTTGWELVTYPVAQCASMSHKDERPISRGLGILLVTVVSIVGYGLIAYWNRLTPRTRATIGALALGALYGFRSTFLSRRHRLIFSMRDGRSLFGRRAPGTTNTNNPAQKRLLNSRSHAACCESNPRCELDRPKQLKPSIPNRFVKSAAFRSTRVAPASTTDISNAEVSKRRAAWCLLALVFANPWR